MKVVVGVLKCALHRVLYQKGWLMVVEVKGVEFGLLHNENENILNFHCN